MSVLFVGQAPSRLGSSPFAGGTGRKLANLCGFDDWSSLRLFKNVRGTNVIKTWRGKSGKGDKFNPTDAEIAKTWAEIGLAVQFGGCSHVVLVGKAVADAMGFKGSPLLRSLPGPGAASFMIIPHTSGVNRFYNEASNRRRTARALRRTIRAACGR